jgi:hypothetical protein
MSRSVCSMLHVLARRVEGIECVDPGLNALNGRCPRMGRPLQCTTVATLSGTNSPPFASHGLAAWIDHILTMIPICVIPVKVFTCALAHMTSRGHGALVLFHTCRMCDQ